MRRLLAVLFVLAAAPLLAQSPHLHAGPEIPIGSVDLGGWPYSPSGERPALATDGDEILLVHASTTNGLFGMRFDRHGRPIDALPKLLLTPNEEFEVHFENSMRVLWHQGAYLIFFLERFKGFHVLRVSRNLEVLSLTAVSRDVSPEFDVVADGDGFVVVSGQAIVRLGSDFAVLQTFDQPWRMDYAQRAAVAVNGRVAVFRRDDPFYSDDKELTLQFLDGATLSESRIVAATAYPRTINSIDAAWTGSELAVMWSECSFSNCRIMRTRLRADGTPMGEPRFLADLRLANHSDDLPLTVLPLGGETVLYLWDRTRANAAAKTSDAWGLRFRGDVAVDAEPLAFGTSHVAAIHTAHDLLFTADATVRVTATVAPATAPLSDPLPITPVTATSANEDLMSAAVTGEEIAIIRKRWRHGASFDESLVAMIASRDGRSVREFPLPGRSATVATDGERFYVAVVDNLYTVWFHELREPASRVAVGHSFYAPGLVWNGIDFLVYELDGDGPGLWFQRVRPDGNLIGGLTAIDAAYDDRRASIIRKGEELLLTTVSGREISTRRLRRHGAPIEPPRFVTAPFAPSFARLATNGPVDALVYTELFALSTHRLGVAFRRDGGPWRVSPDVVERPDRSAVQTAHVIAAGDFFLALYPSYVPGRGHGHTEALLMSEEGILDTMTLAVRCRSGQEGEMLALLPLGAAEALAVYTRVSFEEMHAGAARVFARVLTISTDDHRRRTVRP